MRGKRCIERKCVRHERACFIRISTAEKRVEKGIGGGFWNEIPDETPS